MDWKSGPDHDSLVKSEPREDRRPDQFLIGFIPSYSLTSFLVVLVFRQVDKILEFNADKIRPAGRVAVPSKLRPCFLRVLPIYSRDRDNEGLAGIVSPAESKANYSLKETWLTC